MQLIALNHPPPRRAPPNAAEVRFELQIAQTTIHRRAQARSNAACPPPGLRNCKFRYFSYQGRRPRDSRPDSDTAPGCLRAGPRRATPHPPAAARRRAHPRRHPRAPRFAREPHSTHIHVLTYIRIRQVTFSHLVISMVKILMHFRSCAHRDAAFLSVCHDALCAHDWCALLYIGLMHHASRRGPSNSRPRARSHAIHPARTCIATQHWLVRVRAST